MKYLTYILSDNPIKPEDLISDRRYLHQMTTLVVLPAAVIGFMVVFALVPCAGLMDTIRFTKLRYLQQQRYNRRKCYARHVILSLGHEPTADNVRLLLAI